MRRIILTIAATFAIATAGASSLMLTREDIIPKCPEDAVLIGTGNFEDGRWDRYTCGPAVDDFDPSL